MSGHLPALGELKNLGRAHPAHRLTSISTSSDAKTWVPQQGGSDGGWVKQVGKWAKQAA